MNHHEFIVRGQTFSFDKQLDSSLLDGLEKQKHSVIKYVIAIFFSH